MADRISQEHRSWNMSRIKGKNTGPEKCLRILLHRSGYRYRLHHPKLPGRPDLVLPKYNAVIFVHGCYWHRHRGCPKATMPKTRTEFWKAKFNDTIERDKRKADELKRLGWVVITVWECELDKRPEGVLRYVKGRLEEALCGK